MKKLLALVLVLAMCLSLSACGGAKKSSEDPTKKSEGVMTYAEYDAAALDSQVVVETYVQAKQSWWEDTATLYTQDGDGAYFIYGAACSQADYDKLVEGQKIKVTGYKSEWSGEVEIVDATIEIEDGNWKAEAVDLTDKFASDEDLAKYQNQKVKFTKLTVAAKDDGAAFWYNWDNSGAQGDDVYFDVTVGDATRTFTIESYLCDKGTDVYKAAEALQVGQTIDVEGYLYWYEGPQPHITSITVSK